MARYACVLLVVAACLSLAAAANPDPYYIQAEEVLFDSGAADYCNTSFGASVTFTEDGLGSEYWMGLYRQYTDGNFTSQVPRIAEFVHLGFLGPLITARVGDTVTIVFRNALDFPVNLVPTGFEPVAEGDADFLDPVEANQTVTLKFVVPPEAGPTLNEPATKLWLYKSMVDPTAHAALGLVGAMLIANATDEANAPSRPEGRDIITVTQIIYEYNSPLYEKNMAGRTAASFGMTETELQETQTHHSVNGMLYCAVKGLNMTQGETVRWHTAAVGSDLDMHNVHWHGNTVTLRGNRADIIKMIPGSAYSLSLEAWSTGTWMWHCHVNDHYNGGMILLYTVEPNATAQAVIESQLTGTTRRYYVQAEEVIWDYAPQNAYMCNGDGPANFTADQLTYVGNFSDRIGSRYIKGLYREYTDATYTTRIERSADEEYLGLLGPILRAEVGDTLEVYFKNTLPYQVSMHPHGVWYNKSNEGTPYNDGTPESEKLDDYVNPNGTWNYTWLVPEISGPGPNDLSTKAWLYHSHTMEDMDTYAGLMGAIIIGRKGAFDDDMVASDVDAERVLFFSVMNEQSSLFFDSNLQLFLAGADWNTLLNDTAATESAEGGEATPAGAFQESNLMHSINGFNFCNGPAVPLVRDGITRLHIISLGTEADIHSPNLQHQNLVIDRQATPTAIAMAGSMQTMDLVARGTGTHLLTCRTTDHINAGMMMLYEVVGDTPAAAPVAEAVKTYYIQAEEIVWNYVPMGYDGCTGEAFDDNANQYIEHTPLNVGPESVKAVYKQYTDATFTEEIPGPDHRGFLGPLVFAEVGQTFSVVFSNRVSFPVNFAIDAGLIPLHNPSDAEAQSVDTNGTYTYSYLVPAEAGPQDDDLSTVGTSYGSSVDMSTHQYAGLVGSVVIGKPGAFGTNSTSTDPAAHPVDVDAMVSVMFLTGDESVSPFLLLNLQRTAIDPIAAQNDTNFATTVTRAAINGYLFCNQPDITVPVNSTTRFVTIGMGTETDLHAPAFTSQQMVWRSTHSHSTELFPTVVRSMDLMATAVGRWPFYTETNVHYDEGMRSWLNVTAVTA